MSYILVIWTVVGYAGMSHSTVTKMDWRPIGEFHSEQLCVGGARQLALSSDRFRCIRSK
jgi:hypothetical protein